MGPSSNGCLGTSNACGPHGPLLGVAQAWVREVNVQFTRMAEFWDKEAVQFCSRVETLGEE